MVSYKNLNFNSIKVRLELAYSTLHKYLYHNFNSIKVRLERKSGAITLHSLYNFNSIKVRLERIQLAVIIFYRAFQFHKGTIRTH